MLMILFLKKACHQNHLVITLSLKLCATTVARLDICPVFVLTKSPHQPKIHNMVTAHNTASDPSDDKSVIILTQYEEAMLAQDTSNNHHPINLDLLLLNSQSIVHLFSHPDLVTNIQMVPSPILVNCNKGTLATTEVADFGTTLVYFDSHGIANVLTLYHLGKKSMSLITVRTKVGSLKC
jgi:hypothetical protein